MNPKDAVGQTKPNLSIIPFAPLLEVCGALTEGALKYGPWNWRDEKISETIYADAAIRHLMQFLAGEDIDPDSGIHHVSKAIAGLVILRDAQIHGCSEDNRRATQDLQIPKVMAQIASVHEKLAAKEAESSEAPDAIDVATAAGGGSRKLTRGDIGKTVVLRDGQRVEITDANGPASWSFQYNVVDEEGDEIDQSATEDGWNSADADTRRFDTASDIERQEAFDVVAVVECSRIESDFPMTASDVGNQVDGEGGVDGTIVDWDDKCPCNLKVKVDFGCGDQQWYTPDGVKDPACDDTGYPNRIVGVLR
jgi:hypothetical protein